MFQRIPRFDFQRSKVRDESQLPFIFRIMRWKDHKSFTLLEISSTQTCSSLLIGTWQARGNMFRKGRTRVLVCLYLFAGALLTKGMLKMSKGCFHDTTSASVDCVLFRPQGHCIFTFKNTEICIHMMWWACNSCGLGSNLIWNNHHRPISRYGDFVKNVIYVSSVALLDLSTILRIHYLNRKHVRYKIWGIETVFVVQRYGIGDAVSALRRSTSFIKWGV